MKIFLVITALMLTLITNAQDGLIEYIKKGVESNHYLQSKTLNYESAVMSLDVARKQKSLRVDFNPTYTLAAGGRTIDIPIGDIMNPVYSTLNQLTSSNQFPQIENSSTLLNPHDFYDIKFRASYPVINGNIKLNEGIKQMELSIASEQIETYKQQLISDISKAYYDVQMLYSAINIYTDALGLISENIRVNRELLELGKALPIDLESAENDSIQMLNEIDNTSIQFNQAQAYLNFLVNQSLKQKAIFDQSLLDLPTLPTKTTIEDRPELKQLDHLTSINQKLIALEEEAKKPSVNLFADVGAQDFNFNISSQSFYAIGGIAMNLNVFDGSQAKTKVKLAEAKLNQHLEEKAHLEKQLNLEAYNARQQLQISFNEFSAQEKEIKLYERIYNQQLKRYAIGDVNYITVKDARTDLIAAQIEQNITLFQSWKDFSELKRVLAIQD